MYDRLKAIAAQEKYCEENNAPKFFPRDGYCYRCRSDIFAEESRYYDGSQPYNRRPHGYTVEEASDSLITGCPFCHRSYCD